MRWRSGVRGVFAFSFRRTSVDTNVNEEFNLHLRECEEYLIEQGMSETAARREARQRFGDTGSYRSTCVRIGKRIQRRQKSMEFVRSVGQDLRFALRGMRRYPSFAISVVLTLMLGIGATSAIFAIVDATLLRPPAYPNAERLVSVNAEYSQGFVTPNMRMATARTVQQNLDIASVVYTPRSGARTDLEIPEVLEMLVLDPGIFEILGTSTFLGRPFTQSDVGDRAEPVVILAHHYWKTRFGSDREVVGDIIRIDDTPFRIIGVLPAGLRFLHYGASDVWLPMNAKGMVPGTPNAAQTASLVALANESETLAAVQARVDGISSGMTQRGELPVSIAGFQLRSAGDHGMNSDITTALFVLAGACLLMWLIAVVNGTNLFLVHNTMRITEWKVRLSLGAGRGRIMRQILTEALLLALVSAIVSVGATAATMGGVVTMLPAEVTRWSPNVIAVSDRVILFVFVLSATTGLLFGLVPAVTALRDGNGRSFNESAGRTTVSRGASKLRDGLVTLQVALAVTLLVGATLLTRSFAKLSNVDPGFDTDGVLTMVVQLPEARYGDGLSRAAFREDALNRLRFIPGVMAVTEGTGLPGQTGFSFGGDSVGTEDGSWHVLADKTWVARARVDHEFHRMLGIGLVAGRMLEPADHGRDDVTLIDEEFARVLFGSATAAVGRRVRRGGDGPWRTVIGVTEKTLLLSPSGAPQAHGLDEPQVSFESYLPVKSEPEGYMVFAVKTSDRSVGVVSAVREVVAEVDPLQPVRTIAWLADSYAETIVKPRFNSILMGWLALLATALTLVGVYGVVSFAVSTRRRELGIRIALGAQRLQVGRMVMRSSMRVISLGVVIGMAAAVPLSNTLRTLLFDTSTTDVASFASVGVMIMLAGMAATYVPSRRATQVDPATTLRQE